MEGVIEVEVEGMIPPLLGSQAGVADINHAFYLYYNVACGLSFSRSQPDFEGFLRALRFPPRSPIKVALLNWTLLYKY